MNGPLKFLTARKILPLLDLLAKFKRVLACSCSPNFALLASSQSKFFISARARKTIAVLGMLANARKDHSSPRKNINGHCKAKGRVAGANPTLGKLKCQLTFVTFWFCFTDLLVGLVQHVMKQNNFVYIFQITIACSWIFGIVITFPMFLLRNFDKENDWCVYTWSEEWMGKAYSMVWFLFTGFFPVTFMIALYSQVVYTLWFTRSKPRGRQHCVQQVRN